MTLPTLFDHLEESSCYKEVQLKTFFPAVKISCPPAQEMNPFLVAYPTYCDKGSDMYPSEIVEHNIKRAKYWRKPKKMQLMSC